MGLNETAKLIIAVLVGCALLFGIQTVLDWKQAAEQNQQRGRTLEATSGVLKDGQQADANRAVIDTGVANARDQFNRSTEEDNHNEPETAARADRAVPASRLRAFRERRLARERLGCPRGECEQGPVPANAAER